MNSLPQDFVAWMSRQLPNELSAFLHAYEEPYVRGLRLNPLKPMDADAVIPGLLEPVPWEPQAHYLSIDSEAGALPLHEAGAYYIQEPSAMLPVAALDPKPGENVIDLCAAPGGKSTQIAGRMQGQGLLVCNEPVTKRAQILARNAERLGVMNAVVVSAYPDELARKWPEGFDAVMVDAPCSGEGMFRRHPETRDEWTLANRDGCAKRQLEILESAARLVRPGGRMVYSTCTLNTTENEDVVAQFCDAHPDFSPEPFYLPAADAPTGMLTCYPHRMRGEGQFACRLRRSGDQEAMLPLHREKKPDKTILSALNAFCKDAPEPTAMWGNSLIYLPNLPDISKLQVLRAGIRLGEMKGKLFMPDHEWAMAAVSPAMPRIPLTDEQALHYQAGETVTVDPAYRGFVLPTLHGLALGWGKVSEGIMKNHYPKGLRRPL